MFGKLSFILPIGCFATPPKDILSVCIFPSFDLTGGNVAGYFSWNFVLSSHFAFLRRKNPGLVITSNNSKVTGIVTSLKPDENQGLLTAVSHVNGNTIHH